MKVAPGIYPINGAGPDDPCALTVDFALTYFLVSGELERSKIPVNLLITDASGMSVLTAWAAGKFSSTSVKKFFDEFDIASKINNRTLIIPGKVAVMKGEIQDKLPEWNVVVGTREAVEIVKFLKDGEHIKAAEAVAASKKPAEEKKAEVDVNAPLDFEKIAASIPAIKIRDDLDAHYKQRDPESPKFVTIGERIHCISPVIREAMATFNPDPILERAAQQIKAGATYLDVNIGPAESNGPELMTWAVKLLQENFNNVPLALDTANKRAIEAGIKVYNRTNGKPIVNSADAGSRISYIDLAAANDAICVALCSADGIAKDNEERMMHCHHMLERGLSLGMEATDLWFDPLFLVVKGMQDKQMDVLNAIKWKQAKGDRCRVVIGKDTRRSSYMFEYSLAAGLTASGADTYLLHVTTTPSVSHVIRTEDFDCGIMISASHNPYYDNGIKVMNGNGEKLEESVITEIEKYLDGEMEEIPLAKRENIGRTQDFAAGRNRYIGYLISIATRSFKGKKVGLDCSNGSASSVAKSVVEALSADS